MNKRYEIARIIDPDAFSKLELHVAACKRLGFDIEQTELTLGYENLTKFGTSFALAKADEIIALLQKPVEPNKLRAPAMRARRGENR